jgi:hypothetical protein
LNRNAQITLHIFKALIEKSPRDLPLYAPNVLSVLSTVIASGDLTIVEESLSLFETFCEHQDISTLLADQDYVRRFEDVVKDYCDLSTRSPAAKKGESMYIELRWQSISLRAVKLVASSAALSSNFGRQLAILMPVILQNLYSYPEDDLQNLLQRAGLEKDPEHTLRPRMSISTVKTNDLDPTKSVRTAAEADKLEKEDIGVMAIQSLQKIFEANNRGQIRLGTTYVLQFISGRNNLLAQTGWATAIIEMIAKWAPTQDGHLILVTVMENLMATAITESAFSNQLMLITLVAWLLSSRINLIGLSVMDILLGLLSHMIGIVSLQFTGEEEGAQILSEKPQSTVITKNQLLDSIIECVGDLATHIYYSDQISDMVSSIMYRLRKPDGGDVSPARSGPESSYFTTSEGRIAALKAVKQTLTTANVRQGKSGQGSVSRRKVDIKTFDNTQWLLNDDDINVRRAYVDVLLTWLKLEVERDASKATDLLAASKVSSKKEAEAQLARRAISAATKAKSRRSSFLRLIHVAIYDQALLKADQEEDVTMMHLLLTSLLEKLGVNAACYGLPMIMRLQEDIQIVESAAFKIGIGSICHGYFLALSQKFNFGNSEVGLEIDEELTRRKDKGLWTNSVIVPPLPLDQLTSFPTERDYTIVESESLIPFDNRPGLVEDISTAYGASVSSPVSSPPMSPLRVFNGPILTATETIELPGSTKEQLLSEWTRDDALNSENDSRKTSISGSKAGTHRSNHRQYLGVAGMTRLNESGASPISAAHSIRTNSIKHGLEKFRRSSVAYSSPTQQSISSHGSLVRVDVLKKVLAGEAPPETGSVDGSSDESMVTAEESSPSASEAEDGGTGDQARPATTSTIQESTTGKAENGSVEPQAPPTVAIDDLVANMPGSIHDDVAHLSEKENEAPSTVVFAPEAGHVAVDPHPAINGSRTLSMRSQRSSRKPRSEKAVSLKDAQGQNPKHWNGGGLDLGSLLNGIEARSNATVGGLGRPPY